MWTVWQETTAFVANGVLTVLFDSISQETFIPWGDLDFIVFIHLSLLLITLFAVTPICRFFLQET